MGCWSFLLGIVAAYCWPGRDWRGLFCDADRSIPRLLQRSELSDGKRIDGVAQTDSFCEALGETLSEWRLGR